MSAVRFLPLVLLALGAALIVDAVLRGSAHAALILIVPVLTGGSLEFLVGVVLLFIGLLSLPLLSLASAMESEEEVEPSGGKPASTGSGGVVLIGPVPIFFGEWAGMRGKAYWWWVAVASFLCAAFLVAWVWFSLAG